MKGNVRADNIKNFRKPHHWEKIKTKSTFNRTKSDRDGGGSNVKNNIEIGYKKYPISKRQSYKSNRFI